MSSGARTIADLERKYNFAEMLGMIKNQKVQTKSIIKTQTELLYYLDSVTEGLENLQDQVDGNITTWFYSGVPTLSNLPASGWTNSDKEEHLGDLYYDKATGHGYKFTYENSVYSWEQIGDNGTLQALALANAAQDTADNKRRVFLIQPTPPYDSGDLWVNNNEIYICQLSRATGQYTSGDFINSLKYTDDTKATAVVDELGGTITTILSGQVVQYMANYAKFTDLATGGSTIINGANISTGTINTDNVSIGNDNVLIDQAGIKLRNGAKVIGENGLMNTYLFTSTTLKTCGFTPDDWFAPSSITKDKCELEFFIPTGLNITNAKVTIFHAPLYWSYMDSSYNYQNIWGYCRNLKLYKATNFYSRLYEAVVAGEIKETDTSTYSEISGAFGSNGWTASVPSSLSHNTENTTSIDIKNEISSGLNKIVIQTAESPNNSWNIADICARNGYVYAILKIDGYMSY